MKEFPVIIVYEWNIYKQKKYDQEDINCELHIHVYML